MIPAAVRAELRAHAEAEAPNEACGLLLFDDGVAVRYVRGTNVRPSPSHFELKIDPEVWADIGDTDLEQGIFHSHLASPPRPSKTDVENIGLWEGRPYLILTLRSGELAAWTISDGRIEPLPLVAGH